MIFADTIYYNGNIYTISNNVKKVSSIAVKNKKIIDIGSFNNLKKYINKNTKQIDLQKKTVLPGLIDSHMHLILYGENKLKINLFGLTKKEILKKIKKESKNKTNDKWIIGYGWNSENWIEKSNPSKEDLDELCISNPIMLQRIDGHMIWVNSKTLELAKIKNDTQNPEGGEILRNSNNEILGCLTDMAILPVWAVAPISRPEFKNKAILEVQKELFSYGITSCANSASTIEDIEVIKNLYKNNSLKLRIYNVLSGEWGIWLTDKENEYLKKGIEIGLFEDRFTCRSVKTFMDGSLGSQSAALSDDYSNKPNHKGILVYDDDKLFNIISAIVNNDFQPMIHAIGDLAINKSINVYIKIQDVSFKRPRIEHFQITTDIDIKRIKELGILVSMQPMHSVADKSYVLDHIGHDRYKNSYAWKKILNTGSKISAGSDAPFGDLNPFHGINAFINNYENFIENNEFCQNCISREEAIKAYTIWSAYGQFEESIKGTLEIGKVADLIVIDKDIMECDVDEIRDIKVLKTIIGDEEVFSI